MTDLKVIDREDGVQCMSGRELHAKLNIGTQFTKWMDRMLAGKFEPDVDFHKFTTQRRTNNPKNPFTTETDYALTFDCAAHIAMSQRSEMGHTIRQSILDMQKEALLKMNSQKALPATYKEALLALVAIEEEKDKLIEEAKANEPLVEFANAVMVSDGLVSLNDMAKILSNHFIVGEKRLMNLLKDLKLVNAEGMPYQRYIDRGYFRVGPIKDGVNSKGRPYRMVLKITGKGQVYVTNKVLKHLSDEAQ
ncbi:MAG: phage antirepressor KilAC domain-containing protein [Bacteroidales bacterium]